MEEYITALAGSRPVLIVALLAAADTVFGIFRAARQRKFNSSVGIDGAVRKASMLISLAFLGLLDRLVSIDMAAFIPREIAARAGLGRLGTLEFFSLVYAACEAVSALKNMALCGLPVKRARKIFEGFLGRYTEELPGQKGEKI